MLQKKPEWYLLGPLIVYTEFERPDSNHIARPVHALAVQEPVYVD